MKPSIPVLVILLVSLILAGAACDSGGDCGLPTNWSAATSGGLCQVNFFGETEEAVYCAENGAGGYECACGPISENPLEFTSADFCDLEGEERACKAIEVCGFAF